MPRRKKIKFLRKVKPHLWPGNMRAVLYLNNKRRDTAHPVADGGYEAYSLEGTLISADSIGLISLDGHRLVPA